nr:Maf family protein [Ancylobacter gelatini]
MWRAQEPLVLASKSATRRALLASAGIPVETVDAPVDERALEAAAVAEGVGPAGVASRLAAAKALAGSAARPGRLVLGADQTLALGDEAFHKPADRAAAAAQIARLAGKTHELHAALALARDGEVLFEAADTAHLAMRPLGPDVIATYLDAAGDAVLSSVGAYQLEGLGIHLFQTVEGAHSTILGLPLLPLLAFLRRHGDVL